MKRIFPVGRGLVVTLALLAGGAAARADVMTFDSLLGLDPATEISFYTENDLNLFSLTGPPRHFHPTVNRVNNTAAARIFGTDGSPQAFTYLENFFDLVSIDFFGTIVPAPVTFTSSSGAVQVVTSPGIVTFGPGFQGVTFVRVDIPSNGVANIDDVVFRPGPTAVPEPPTFVLLILAAVFLAGYVRPRPAEPLP